MRLWRDAAGNILTDEQVLRHIATFGSLSAARDAGEIELLSESAARGRSSLGHRGPHGRKLSDYLDFGEDERL